MMKTGKIVFVLMLMLTLQGCIKVKYSFSGANISPEMQTFSVDHFQNRSLLIVPSLSSEFTEALRTYINDRTRLREVTDGMGDAKFEGEIVSFTQKPINITSQEIATSNRLTIDIKCRYTDAFNEKNNFESNFSHYADYSVDADYTSIEAGLIKEITTKIIEDIFNKAFVNW